MLSLRIFFAASVSVTRMKAVGKYNMLNHHNSLILKMSAQLRMAD